MKIKITDWYELVKATVLHKDFIQMHLQILDEIGNHPIHREYIVSNPSANVFRYQGYNFPMVGIEVIGDKEMTIKEIEKELGYTIKIIKD